MKHKEDMKQSKEEGKKRQKTIPKGKLHKQNKRQRKQYVDSRNIKG